MKDHHYFASCVLGWATADTRDAAINRLVDGFRSDIKQITANSQKSGHPGMYVWSCKVNVPDDDEHDYSIEFYAPVGVDKSDGQSHAITYVSKRDIAYMRDESSELRELRRAAEPKPVEIIEIKRNIDLVMIRDTDGKIKYRSKGDFTRQQMADHAAMRQAEGGGQL